MFKLLLAAGAALLLIGGPALTNTVTFTGLTNELDWIEDGILVDGSTGAGAVLGGDGAAKTDSDPSSAYTSRFDLRPLSQLGFENPTFDLLPSSPSCRDIGCSVLVTGILRHVDVASQIFTVTDNAITVILGPEFAFLTELNFQGITTGAVAVDNIDLTVVPLPLAFWSLLGALGLLPLLRRYGNSRKGAEKLPHIAALG